MNSRLVLVTGVVVGVLALACSDVSKANGTALFVRNDVRGVDGGTHLSLVGREGTQTIFGPSILPEDIDGGHLAPLEGVPTVRVLLNDEWAGHSVIIHGELYADAGIIGVADSAPIDVVKGEEVDANLVFAAPPVTGVPCAGCTGCCQGDMCMEATVDHCGSLGQACFACDKNTSNVCQQDACGCGSGPACGSGLKCILGFCVCSKDTCPGGCCMNNQCMAGTGDTACGSKGALCQDCTKGGGPGPGKTCQMQQCK